jgi:uncharacterized protein (DUF3084 family)
MSDGVIALAVAILLTMLLLAGWLGYHDRLFVAYREALREAVRKRDELAGDVDLLQEELDFLRKVRGLELERIRLWEEREKIWQAREAIWERAAGPRLEPGPDDLPSSSDLDFGEDLAMK